MAERDLVIVGGGPAGISTALHLVRAAPALTDRVIVLEKERYPRDKYCAGAVGSRALRLLDRLGFRPAVPRVPVHAIELRLGRREHLVREPDMGVVVRRLEFDHALANEARSRGIEVREGAAVEGVDVRDDTVHVRIARSGAVRACAVVGADGVAGVIRRSAGFARGHRRAQVVELDTEGVRGDPPRDTLRFDLDVPGLTGYTWDFPTLVDGRELVCRGVYRILDGDGEGAHAHLGKHLADKGLDVDGYRVKAFAERGFEPRAPIAKKRVLLVGEAAGIDIATGEGIAQAMEYGALAGTYLASAFARGDFSFSDWTATVHMSEVGRNLRQRLWFADRFYSSQRPALERLTLHASACLQIGARQYAGKRIGGLRVGKLLAQLIPAVASVGPAATLRLVQGDGRACAAK